jgi:hypothetical protein
MFPLSFTVIYIFQHNSQKISLREYHEVSKDDDSLDPLSVREESAMEKEHRQLSIIAFALFSPTQNHASRSKACALEKSCFVELDTGKKNNQF